MVCSYCINDTPRTEAQLKDRRASAELLGARLHIIPCSQCAGTDYYLTDRFVARPLPLMDGLPVMSLKPLINGFLLMLVLLALLIALILWVTA